MKTVLCVIILGVTCSIMSSQNYEESKVPNFELPDVLLSSEGVMINDSTGWLKQRQAILNLLQREMYGVFPDDGVLVKFNEEFVDDNALEGRAIQKQILLTLYNDKKSIDIQLLIFLPKGVADAPVFLGYNFWGNQTICSETSIPITTGWVPNKENLSDGNNRAIETSRGLRSHRWALENILTRGYGLATLHYGEVDPDFDDGFENGIHSLVDDHGDANLSSLSAWAYVLCKAMDYFVSDAMINEDKVILFGHSRLGKTSLLAGALDERFAMVISNNSGCGGAALSKRKFGETLKAINSSFPHWFSSNFKEYNDKEEKLPFDQHYLLSLIAPRPIYVASAEDDLWADPKGEYLSLFHAGPVYNLYGFTPFDQDLIPLLNEPVQSGRMGYHVRSGKHDVTEYDWERYMDFADIYVK